MSFWESFEKVLLTLPRVFKIILFLPLLIVMPDVDDDEV